MPGCSLLRGRTFALHEDERVLGEAELQYVFQPQIERGGARISNTSGAAYRKRDAPQIETLQLS